MLSAVLDTSTTARWGRAAVPLRRVDAVHVQREMAARGWVAAVAVSWPNVTPGPRVHDGPLVAPPENPDVACLELLASARRRLAAYVRTAARDVADAEDLAADVVARAWVCRGALVSHGAPIAQLIQYAREVCRGHVAAVRHDRVMRSALQIDLGQWDDAETGNDRQCLIAECASWVGELPDRQRAAISLHLICDYSLVETAAALGCSLSAAKTHYYRAIRTLRHKAKSLSTDK